MRFHFGSRLKTGLTIVILVTIYVLVAKLGQILVNRGVDVTVVWLPSGVALAALFLFGYRLWPGILVGSFLVYSSEILRSAGSAATPDGTLSTAVLSVSDTFEALLAAFLLRRLIGPRTPCYHPQDVLKFAFFAGVLSCAAGATVSLTVLGITGDLGGDGLGSMWLYWWLAHTIGVLVMTPVIIGWYSNRQLDWGRHRMIESLAILVLLVITANSVFGGWVTSETAEIPLSCVAVLLLLWPALRFSQRETATAVFVLVAIAIWGSTKGYGPFADEPGTESILMLQGFVGVVAVSSLGVAADIAYRKRMRRGLQRYKMASLQTADHWMITDRRGIIQEVNPSFEQVTGYSERELLGRTPSILKSGKHEKTYYTKMWKTILSGDPYRGVVINRKKNGELFYEMKTITPIKDEDGVITHFLSIGKDVTELKLAEQRLKKGAKELEKINKRLFASEEALLRYTGILESVFNTMDEGVVVANEEGHLVMFNEAAGNILGIGLTDASPDQWTAKYGIHLPDMVTPFPTEKLPLVRALNGERTEEVEMFIQNPNLERGCWLEVGGRPLGDSDENVMGAVAVFRDITQRKLVERVQKELKDTREEIEIARKIQRNLFPESAPKMNGYDIGGASKPAVATGGDYYDYFEMPGGSLGLVVGDVSGHGFGPALLMASVRAYLHSLVESGVDPREMLNITNRLIAGATGDEDIDTLIFAQLDPTTRSLE
ncbi:MAG: MASE1 domain-containing protein, partial [Candidatus Latescibacterota bacterium]